MGAAVSSPPPSQAQDKGTRRPKGPKREGRGPRGAGGGPRAAHRGPIGQPSPPPAMSLSPPETKLPQNPTRCAGVQAAGPTRLRARNSRIPGDLPISAGVTVPSRHRHHTQNALPPTHTRRKSRAVAQVLVCVIVTLTPSLSRSPSPQSPVTWGWRVNQTGLDSNPSTSPPAV